MVVQDHKQVLQVLHKELFEEGILHDGDSIGTDDETLLRFLRARKFDLKQTKKMIKDCQQWRRNVEGVGIDELYRRIDPFDYPEHDAIFECWPIWFHKTDKQGRPVNFQILTKINIPELNKRVTPERHWQTLVVSAEAVVREIFPAASRKAGKYIGQTLCIVDLKNFGLSQFLQMQNLIRMSFQMSQDYYPETMAKILAINAPSSFTFIWSMIKPWLSKETSAKVDIRGANYQAVLLDLIDEENLPSMYGGKCTCSNGEGNRCQYSLAGPWIEGRVGWGPRAENVEKERIASSGHVDDASINLETEKMDASQDSTFAVSVEVCA